MDMHRDLKNKDGYFSYLLRIWQLKKSENPSTAKKNLWRVSLESTRTRNRVNFINLEDMLLFLKDKFALMDETSDGSKR